MLAEILILCISAIMLILGCTILVSSTINIISPTITPTPSVTITPVPFASYARYLFLPHFTNPATLSIVDTQTIDPVTSTLKVYNNINLGVSIGAFFATVSADQKFVYVSNSVSSTISVVDVSNISNIPPPTTINFSSIVAANPLLNLTEMKSPNGSVLSTDGTKLFVCCTASSVGGIAVFNTSDNTFSSFVTSASFAGPFQVVINSDGTLLFISNLYSTPSTIIVLSTITLTVVAVSQLGISTTSLQRICINPKSTYVYGIPKSPGAPISQALYTMTTASTFAVLTSPNNLISNCLQTCITDDGLTVFGISSLSFPPSTFSAIDVRNPNQPFLIATIPIPNSFLTGITCDFQNLYIIDNNGTVYVRSVKPPYIQSYTDILVSPAFITFPSDMRL